MARTLLLAAIVGMAFAAAPPSPARGDESPGPAASALPGDDEIAALCRQLGDPDFFLRERATKQLISGGRAVIDEVAAAAETDVLEIVMRCLLVLRELYQRPEGTTKEAARAALEKLSAGRHRAAARRADEILHPPEPFSPAAQRLLLRANFPGGARGVRVLQAANPAGPVGAGIRIRTMNVNGNVTVNAEEGGREVRITHRNEEDIVVSVTEPPAAGEKEGKTTESRAKDLAELKDKHPEAYRLYERYGGGARRLLGGGFDLPK